MKILRWIIRIVLSFLALVALIAICSIAMFLLKGYTFHDPVEKDIPSDQQFSPALLKDDLAFLIETLEAVHPDLYASVGADVIGQHRVHLEKQLSAPLDDVQFYKRIAPLVALFEDGHTRVKIPLRAFNSFCNKRGLVFPVSVFYEAGRGLTVGATNNGLDGLATGDRIFSINDLDADSLFLVFRKGLSGERQAFRNQLTSSYFRTMLWLHDIQAPFHIEYANAKVGLQRRVTAQGVSCSEIARQDRLAQSRRSSVAPYEYIRLPEGIGYIDIRRMVNVNQFAAFLEDVFTDIQQNVVQGLIFDLRANLGGQSQLNDKLLPYLTDRAYALNGGKAWKLSRQYRTYVMRRYLPASLRWVTAPPTIWLIRLFREEAKTFMAPDGEIVRFSYTSEPRKPEPNQLRYTGKICFLIGSGTFSAATTLADVVKHNRIATLIGEETGGTPNQFAEVYPFKLPHTRLQIFSSSARFIRVNGDTHNRNGVIPDIEVLQTDEDLRNGVDTVLESAKEWILRQ